MLLCVFLTYKDFFLQNHYAIIVYNKININSLLNII